MAPARTAELHRFDDFNDAFRHVVDLLPRELPERARFALAHNFVLLFDDGLVDEWPREPSPPTSEQAGANFGAPFGYCKDTYAIRSSDIRDLLSHLASLIGLGVSVDGLSPHASTVLLTLSGFWGLHRLTRMGADLSPIQRQVLLTLRKRGPLALDALTDAAIGFGEEWSREEIEAALGELRTKMLRDQRVEALVRQNSDGLWVTEARGLWELPVYFGDVHLL